MRFAKPVITVSLVVNNRVIVGPEPVVRSAPDIFCWNSDKI